MPNLVRPDNSVATSLEDKEALIREAAFPQAPNSEASTVNLPPGEAYKRVTEQAVYAALYSQAVGKAPGEDQLNFAAIRLLWSWDKGRLIEVYWQCFRLSTHPRA